MADFLEAAKGILTTIAPTIATALGGPLAGVATQKLLGALGMTEETKPEELMKTIANATPEQLLEIKKVEQQFILDLKKLDIDVMKIQAGDTASARQREVATQDWTPRLLAGLILSLYIGVQWYILGHVIDQGMREIVMRSLGTLDAAVGLILGYYFGSSLGSHLKDQKMVASGGEQK